MQAALYKNRGDGKERMRSHRDKGERRKEKGERGESPSLLSNVGLRIQANNHLNAKPFPRLGGDIFGLRGFSVSGLRRSPLRAYLENTTSLILNQVQGHIVPDLNGVAGEDCIQHRTIP